MEVYTNHLPKFGPKRNKNGEIVRDPTLALFFSGERKSVATRPPDRRLPPPPPTTTLSRELARRLIISGCLVEKYPPSPPLLAAGCLVCLPRRRTMAAEKEQEFDLQKITEAFRALRKKAKELGIKDSQVSKIAALKSLQRKRLTGSRFVLASVAFGLLGVLCGIGVVLHQQDLVTHQSLYKFMQYVTDFDMDKDICVIPYPEIILDMFRPPVNCSLCKEVHKVDRVSALSREEFVRKYAYTGRPVVISDGTKDWTASQYFSFNYFKSIYGPDSPVLSEDQKCQFFPYKTSFTSLKEVFNMSEKDANMEGNPWYIGW